MATAPRASERTLATIRKHTAELSTAATARLESHHEWYGELAAEDRSWISVLAHNGITAFLSWLGGDADAADADIFDSAPRELARKISLEQALDIIRDVIEIVEEQAPSFVETAEAAQVQHAVMRYSREIAFGAARVYARAAESRGAWDARLESLVVDAVVRGEPDESLGSRVNALGWADVKGVCVVVGSSPLGQESSVVDPLRRAARHVGLEILVSVEGRRMIVVLGGLKRDPVSAAAAVVNHFGPGPVVTGPMVPHLYAAGRSARAALHGFDAAWALEGAPRPVASEELLAARAVAGDDGARRSLATMARSHLDASTPLGQTARVYLRTGSLEATARELFVHTNTVRYRLGKVSELTGYDLTDGDDAFAIRLAMMLADLSTRRPSARTRSSHLEESSKLHS